MYICIHICIYIYIYICVYVYACVYTCIYCFTGNQFVAMNRINILTKPHTGNVNPVKNKNSWNSVYYKGSGLAEFNADIKPASYSLYVAVVRESSGGLTLSEVEVFGYGYGYGE